MNWCGSYVCASGYRVTIQHGRVWVTVNVALDGHRYLRRRIRTEEATGAPFRRGFVLIKGSRRYPCWFATRQSWLNEYGVGLLNITTVHQRPLVLPFICRVPDDAQKRRRCG